MAPAVGRDIDNWCNRCKAELAHTILAMVQGQPARVRCNTCGSERNFRMTKAATKRPSKRRVATTAPAGRKPQQQLHRERFERRLAEIDRDTCVAYSPRMRAIAGQLIEHKTFGYGIVDEVMGTKAMVSFQVGMKTLAVNR
ncbi:MAG TPA: hypothetical protein DCQ06_11420 [Myxococcales bacterium]|nr:hypothetical protein [Myxococcales bacterium]HAN32198.1 hypothetical protein [Myxococcales bacterium]